MLSALRRLGIVIAIGVAFVFGLATTVYLSLRSPEVTVPEVVGMDRFTAESDLQAAGLNFRVRATRPSKQAKADTVMFQLPRAGEVVKKGQTVAVDIARVPKEGEASEAVSAPEKTNANENNNANQTSSTNENKPKRKANANANANGNANNANGNSNSANRNTNRPNANAKQNENSGNTNVTPRPANANRSPQTEDANTNRANRNVNRAPTPARPAPTPGTR
jgi:beta-lactam-binding protein with PASTA domain